MGWNSEKTALACRLIGHEFHDSQLLRSVFTHRSCTRRTARNYERLEFLGDHILAFVIAEQLYARFPSENEGTLSLRLAAAVRRETIAEIVESLGVSGLIALAPSDKDESRNPSILADIGESLIGGLYLDGGMPAAQKFVIAHWDRYISGPLPARDPKSRLQEWALARALPLPEYEVVAVSGPDHAPQFEVELKVKSRKAVKGRGGSRRLAEKHAAQRFLMYHTEKTEAL